jgi:simple sugar transport system permease protein
MARLIEFLFITRTIWAILLALLAGSIMMAGVGVNPVIAYRTLFGEAFLDYYGLGATLVKMSPILLAGLAVVVPMRAGLFNIGGEGQIYIGALFSSAIALYAPRMNSEVQLLLSILAGATGGALWAAIPGYLKAYRGIDEVIVTLLMNYVGIDIVSYAAGGPMMEPGAPYPYSAEISRNLWLPTIMPHTGAHIGALVGIALAIFLHWLMHFTTVGFAVTTVGKNVTAARYAGISVRSQIMMAMVLGGSLAGLAGSFEVLGVKYRLFHMFSNGYGFDGIVVAFIAGANLLLVPLAALFLAGLKAGALLMQRAVGVESAVADAIQGLVVIFVAAALALRFQNSYWSRILTRRRTIANGLNGKRIDG